MAQDKQDEKKIEDNKWEDIWNEFQKTDLYRNIIYRSVHFVFVTWLKENYTPPEKK